MPVFNQLPFVAVHDTEAVCLVGWRAVLEELQRATKVRAQTRTVLVLECYPGVDTETMAAALHRYLKPDLMVDAALALLPPAQIEALVAPELTNDPLFGKLTHLQLRQLYSEADLALWQQRIAATDGLIVVYGVGASFLLGERLPDLLAYADLGRWEAQRRFRGGRSANLGAQNRGEQPSLQYKRAYFLDWRLADRHKKACMERWDYVLDCNQDAPKMISGAAFHSAMTQATRQPFSLVPFFDPGPWGGQWMKSVCGLDPAVSNYAWCFNCVPEENSLLLGFGATRFETPALNLVLREPHALLGEQVHARFGCEFPIRFDYLDTMGGGNLSLQVHPLTEYIQEHFGMHYTQDESYYIMAAAPGAVVYLGLKDGIQPAAMIQDLRLAQTGGPAFPADEHIARWPCQAHDHFLIPAGTVHCSGANSVVLEISATPYIFTFKLWDWNRLGLDGKPRPINIEHGRKVIQWDRTESWTREQLINRIRPVDAGDGWREESTGLHEREFIETRRHWFQNSVPHHARGTVNVLTLVAGEQIVVESPTAAFAPMLVNYAETFIVPAAVGAYTIRPATAATKARGITPYATIKAFVR